MYHSTQAPWQQPPRVPTEGEPPAFPRRRRDRRKVVAVLAVIGVAALVAALAGTKGFGLFDGIPGYRATYHDEAWGFTLSPPRPYVVKVDTETYDVRALLVFDPKVWDAEYPTWAAMTVICDRPDDYVQPSLADLTDSHVYIVDQTEVKGEMPKQVQVMRDLVAMILLSPDKVETTPGFVAFVTQLLGSRNINIFEFISCFTNTVIILDSKDALSAFSLLQKYS